MNQLISLENFDENFHGDSSKVPIINSPRSLEACKIQGIRPEELIIKQLDDIKKIYPDNNLNQQSLKIKQNHYDERRQEKLKILLEEREKIIEEEKANLWVQGAGGELRKVFKRPGESSKSKSKNEMGGTISLIDREKKQLEKIKFKQQKEVEQILEQERKMLEIREANQKKLEKQKQRELQREQELGDKRKEQEQIKNQIELDKRVKAEQLQFEQKIRAQEIYQQEQDRLKEEEFKQKQKKEEMKQMEEEKKRKQFEFKLQAEENNRLQKQEAEQRKLKQEQKDELRQQALDEKRRELGMMSEAKKLLHEEKLQQAKQKGDLEIIKIQQEYLRKQELNEEKLKAFDLEREEQIKENRKRQIQHDEQIQQIIINGKKKEEDRKNEYLEKMQEAEMRLEERQLQEEIEMKEKQRIEEEKEMQRKQVKINNDLQMKYKVGALQQTIKLKEENVKKAQKERKLELIKKATIDSIKRIDRRENVEKIQLMQQYDRMQLDNQINDKMKRADSIMEEKSKLLKKRENARKKIEIKKRTMAEKIEQVKLGKLDPNSIMNQFRSQQNKPPSRKSMANTSSGKEFQNQSFEQQSDLQEQKRAQTAGANRPEKKGQAPQVKVALSQREIIRIIEDLKVQQNQEMLRLLENEQREEEKREIMLEKVFDPKEIKRLEKLFGMERAKAQAKLQSLTDQQEIELAKAQKKYGLLKDS